MSESKQPWMLGDYDGFEVLSALRKSIKLGDVEHQSSGRVSPRIFADGEAGQHGIEPDCLGVAQRPPRVTPRHQPGTRFIFTPRVGVS